MPIKKNRKGGPYESRHQTEARLGPLFCRRVRFLRQAAVTKERKSCLGAGDLRAPAIEKMLTISRWAG